MSKAQLLEERQTRILKAIALESPNRTPVVLEYAGFAAKVTNTPLPEFLGSLSKSVDVMIEAFHIVGDGLRCLELNYPMTRCIRSPNLNL
jgi:hypothetical protein